MAHTLGTQERALSITTIINVQLTGPIYNCVLVTHSNIYKFWAAAAAIVRDRQRQESPWT